MTENPDTSRKERKFIPISDVPHAPFIFFEVAPAFGLAHGVMNVTLAASRTWTNQDGAITDHVVTAYLRGNIAAFHSLRQAIDSAMLLATPTADGKAN